MKDDFGLQKRFVPDPNYKPKYASTVVTKRRRSKPISWVSKNGEPKPLLVQVAEYIRERKKNPKVRHYLRANGDLVVSYGLGPDDDIVLPKEYLEEHANNPLRRR